MQILAMRFMFLGKSPQEKNQKEETQIKTVGVAISISQLSRFSKGPDDPIQTVGIKTGISSSNSFSHGPDDPISTIGFKPVHQPWVRFSKSPNNL